MDTGTASGEVFHADRSHIVHAIRMPPDVDEALLPHVSRWKRELDAGKYIPIRGNIAGGMTRATGQSPQGILIRSGNGTEFIDIFHQVPIPKNLAKRVSADSKPQDRTVPIHHGWNGGVQRALNIRLLGQRPNT